MMLREGLDQGCVMTEVSKEFDAAERDSYFPQEILEKILKYVDGETLLVCQKVSSQFSNAVLYLTSKNIWKKCCYHEELPKMSMFHIISKLYPHTVLDVPRDWKLVYESALTLKKLSQTTKWIVVAISAATKFSEICDIITHGNLILAFLRYNKSFSIYNKIKTISGTRVVDKSIRFNSESLYITPAKSEDVAEDTLLLFCEHCKLVAIPVTSARRNPKFLTNSGSVTVENDNGDLFRFSNGLGLLGKCKCTWVRNQFEWLPLIRVTFKFSNVRVSCGNKFRDFNAMQFLHARVTCARVYGSLILLGTETGMLYGYICRVEGDLSDLELTSHVLRLPVSTIPLLAIDVMAIDNEFSLVCCTSRWIYHIKMKAD